MMHCIKFINIFVSRDTADFHIYHNYEESNWVIMCPLWLIELLGVFARIIDLQSGILDNEVAFSITEK